MSYMEMRDETYMAIALEETRLAFDEGEVPIGAVVVCDGEVVARAHNRRETDADPSAHAEFAAMVAASQALERWRLTGCTVYVTLEPCLMCAGLMVNSRIDRCVYGAPDPKGGALGTLYDVSHDPRRRVRRAATHLLPRAPRSTKGRSCLSVSSGRGRAYPIISWQSSTLRASESCSIWSASR